MERQETQIFTIDDENNNVSEQENLSPPAQNVSQPWETMGAQPQRANSETLPCTLPAEEDDEIVRKKVRLLFDILGDAQLIAYMKQKSEEF